MKVSRFEQRRSEAERLDQHWDDLVQGHMAGEADPTLRLLHASLRSVPNPHFVGQLRSTLRTEASRRESAPAVRPSREKLVLPFRMDRRQRAPIWMAARRKPGLWATCGLVAIVTLLYVTVMRPTYWSGSNEPSSVPAGYVATSSPEWAGPADELIPGTPTSDHGVTLGSVWPFGAGGAGDFTIPESTDPLRIRLARIELPRDASMTFLPSAIADFIPIRGTVSITNPSLAGEWHAVPSGSSVGLATDAPTTIANRGEEPVLMSALAIGTGEAFGEATGGAEIVMLVDVTLDRLRAGPARYTYEGRMMATNAGVIEDASRDGVALLVVDEGAFAVIRDGGAWEFGRVGSPHSSETILDDGFSTDGHVVLGSGDYAVITAGAAFHGTAASGGGARFFLLTIEINSAVVQEAEGRVANNAAPTPDEMDESTATSRSEAD
jgi:hypothetical protein